MRQIILLIVVTLLLSACALSPITATSSPVPPTGTFTPIPVPPSETPVPLVTSSSTAAPLVPDFEYIVVIVFENKEFDRVIGNPDMPVFNQFANDYTLLTQHYAVKHPSLPNYIAMIGGDTFEIDRNCEDCFISRSEPARPDRSQRADVENLSGGYAPAMFRWLVGRLCPETQPVHVL